MKPVLTFLLIAFLVSACGGDSNGTTADPRQGTPGTGKWSAQDFKTQTDSCIARGSTNYSADTWRKYCECVFLEAAKEWTYEQYKQNTYDKIMTLYQKGVVTGCADKAGIRYQ